MFGLGPWPLPSPLPVSPPPPKQTVNGPDVSSFNLGVLSLGAVGLGLSECCRYCGGMMNCAFGFSLHGTVARSSTGQDSLGYLWAPSWFSGKWMPQLRRDSGPCAQRLGVSASFFPGFPFSFHQICSLGFQQSSSSSYSNNNKPQGGGCLMSFSPPPPYVLFNKGRRVSGHTWDTWLLLTLFSGPFLLYWTVELLGDADIFSRSLMV